VHWVKGGTAEVTAGAFQSSVRRRRKADVLGGDNDNTKFGAAICQEQSNVFTELKAWVDADLVGVGRDETESEYRNVLQHEVVPGRITNLCAFEHLSF
jgi:hypothetical protein